MTTNFSPDFNVDGEDPNYSAHTLDYLFNRTFIFKLASQMLMIAFVFAILVMSSMKRRTTEMALLRGIGMTSFQMTCMIVLENMMTSLLALLAALPVGYGLYRLLAYMQNTITYQHSISTIGFFISILWVICVAISILPVYNLS